MHRAISAALASLLICFSEIAAKDLNRVIATPVLASDIPNIGMAAYRGELTILRNLIASGNGLEITGGDKRTPLILASAGGHPEAVTVLLEAGAKVDAQDITGTTALHWAAKRRDERVALLLLSHRPEIDLQNKYGETALILAAEEGETTIVKALIDAGANCDLKDGDNRTASAWAKMNKYPDIVSLLEKPQ